MYGEEKSELGGAFELTQKDRLDQLCANVYRTMDHFGDMTVLNMQ